MVMHGGSDVWPGSYGEVPLKDAWLGDRVRDLYDLAVVEAFEQQGKPIFGVCRGLQLINVAFGGTLYQDIETQHPGAMQHRNATAYDQHFHEVDIVPGTRLARLYPGQPRVTVNSIPPPGDQEPRAGLRHRGLELPRRGARGHPPPPRPRARLHRRPRNGTRSSAPRAARCWTTRRCCTTSWPPAPTRAHAPGRATARCTSATARSACCAARCCGSADYPK
ncbi:peptidase c26 [Alicycliphilus sp. B1]|nr:peptidase c26 [Alicycliphilus sp. B1]